MKAENTYDHCSWIEGIRVLQTNILVANLAFGKLALAFQSTFSLVGIQLQQMRKLVGFLRIGEKRKGIHVDVKEQRILMVEENLDVGGGSMRRGYQLLSRDSGMY